MPSRALHYIWLKILVEFLHYDWFRGDRRSTTLRRTNTVCKYFSSILSLNDVSASGEISVQAVSSKTSDFHLSKEESGLKLIIQEEFKDCCSLSLLD